MDGESTERTFIVGDDQNDNLYLTFDSSGRIFEVGLMGGGSLTICGISAGEQWIKAKKSLASLGINENNIDYFYDEYTDEMKELLNLAKAAGNNPRF